MIMEELEAIGPALRALVDKDQIVTALKCYPTGLDELDIPRFLSMFDAHIVLDLESWNGVAAQRIATRDWANSVMPRLSGFGATQHLLSLPDIAFHGDGAWSRPEFMAVHRFGSEGAHQIHAIGGYYEHMWRRTGTGWVVTSLKLVLAWERGDRRLFARAMEQPEKRPIRN